MNHEPECTYSELSSTPFCTCNIIRAAYQRGMQRAADIAQARHDDMLWCSKPDDCQDFREGRTFKCECECHRTAARGEGQ